LEAQKATLLAIGGTEQEIAVLDAEIKKLRELSGLQGQEDTLRTQAALWNDISDRAGHFFADLITNGTKAFTNLRDELKSFVADMVALFAKRWILQLGA